MDLNQFFRDLSSEKPVPGGGSASCIAAAMGVSLLEMVGRLSLGRGKDDAVNKEFEKILEDLAGKKDRLFRLSEEDAEGYQRVMKAFRLPKQTEEEKRRRASEIQQAFEGAISPPLTLMGISNDLLDATAFVLKHGNPNAFSDTAVAFHLFQVAFEGGKMNVLINLGSLKTASRREFILTQLSALKDTFEKRRAVVEGMIESWISKIPL